MTQHTQHTQSTQRTIYKMPSNAIRRTSTHIDLVNVYRYKVYARRSTKPSSNFRLVAEVSTYDKATEVANKAPHNVDKKIIQQLYVLHSYISNIQQLEYHLIKETVIVKLDGRG